jgi:hypothetical protein
MSSQRQRKELEDKFDILFDYAKEKLVSQVLCVSGIPENVVKNHACRTNNGDLYRTKFLIDVDSIQFDGNATAVVKVTLCGETDAVQQAKGIIEPRMANTVWGDDWYQTTVNIYAEIPKIFND